MHSLETKTGVFKPDFYEYFHTSVPLKLIFVFVLNLVQVDITDRQYLNLNQA